MDMQDKDFDKLFNQKFDDFEVEPSSAVWDNITAELDGKKKPVRTITPWLSIAAAILILAVAGVLFLWKDRQPGAEDKTNKLVKAPVKPIQSVKQQTENVLPQQSVVTVKPVLAKATKPKAKSSQSNVAPITGTIIPMDVTPADIVEHDPLVSNPVVIASLNVPASTHAQTTLPDVPLTPRVLDADTQSAATASTEKQTTEPAKKRGIHNLGGLINAVVAKLDKRESKLIEFSDGDDDDDNATKLTGVNLGLIKIKKQ